MNRLEILDFDRTIGRVDAYTDGVIEHLVASDHITDTQQIEIREALDHPDTVDLIQLIGRYGVKGIHVQDAVKGLPREDVVYPDAASFLDDTTRTIWVVTSAMNHDFQRAKLVTAGVSSMSTIVKGRKGEFIRDSLSRDVEGSVWTRLYAFEAKFDEIRVVDDRFEQIEALIGIEGVVPVLLQREDAKYQATEEQMGRLQVIASLAELD